jgi:hypothetical protein
MPNKPQPKKVPLPDFDKAEQAFNVETLHGFFAANAAEALLGMHEQGVKYAEAAMITAAISFAAKTWMETALASGVPAQKARETAEREFRTYLRKWGSAHLEAKGKAS